MAKIYQPKNNNQYYLPNDVYYATIYFIRGYDRRRMEADAIIEESPAPPDGMPRGSFIGDPVAAKVSRRDKLLAKNRLIDNALETIPIQYRSAILQNILYDTAYPVDDIGLPLHAKSTWQKYKARVIFDVATSLDLV